MRSVFDKKILMIFVAVALCFLPSHYATARMTGDSVGEDSSGVVDVPDVSIDEDNSDDDLDQSSASIRSLKYSSPDTLRPYTPSGVVVKDSRRSSSLYIIYKGRKYLRK